MEKDIKTRQLHTCCKGEESRNDLVYLRNFNSNARYPSTRSENRSVRSTHSREGNDSSACGDLCTHALSTIGLILVVIGYCCLGGAVFEWLESNTENETVVEDRVHVTALVKQHATNLYTRIRLDEMNTANLKDDIGAILLNVTRDAFHVANDGSWDGKRIGQPLTLDWTLPGAILFSATTITTIGYGFVTPKTDTGRIICIFYSVFGIPITMLAIASLGLWFAQQVPVIVSLIILAGYILGGAALFSAFEENIGFADGAYFSFITLTTIGFGDIVPGVYKGKGDWTALATQAQTIKLIICCLYLFVGLSLLAMSLDLMKEEVRANFIWLGHKMNIIKQRPAAEVIDEFVKQQGGD